MGAANLTNEQIQAAVVKHWSDQFTATTDFTLTEGAGGQCALAVGNLIPDQLDQLPCDLELGGSAAYK